MKKFFLTCIKKLVHKCELVQQCVYKNFKSLNNLINKNEKKIFCNVEKNWFTNVNWFRNVYTKIFNVKKFSSQK